MQYEKSQEGLETRRIDGGDELVVEGQAKLPQHLHLECWQQHKPSNRGGTNAAGPKTKIPRLRSSSGEGQSLPVGRSTEFFQEYYIMFNERCQKVYTLLTRL